MCKLLYAPNERLSQLGLQVVTSVFTTTTKTKVTNRVVFVSLIRL